MRRRFFKSSGQTSRIGIPFWNGYGNNYESGTLSRCDFVSLRRAVIAGEWAALSPGTGDMMERTHGKPCRTATAVAACHHKHDHDFTAR